MLLVRPDELTVAVRECLLTMSLSRKSLTETMSELNWREGKWESFGKDLETALESQEAQACTA